MYANSFLKRCMIIFENRTHESYCSENSLKSKDTPNLHSASDVLCQQKLSLYGTSAPRIDFELFATEGKVFKPNDQKFFIC